MNSSSLPAAPLLAPTDTEPDGGAPWHLRRALRSEAGVDVAQHLLGPGAEYAETAAEAARGRVLYVAGSVLTVATGPTHELVSPEEARVLLAERPAVLSNRTQRPVRVVIVTLPVVRRAPTTSLTTFA